MSNVNTDQRLIAGQVAPIAAPTAATVTYFQFASSALSQSSQTGVAQIPIPGQYKATAKKVKVRIFGNTKAATVGSQAFTFTINAVNTAGTVAVIATTGAVAAATVAGATIGWYLEAEFLLDPLAATIMAGEYQGVTLSGAGQALVARTILTNQPGFTESVITGVGAIEGYDESQYFRVAVTQAIADATAVHTLLELSSEVL
jgi:hypothetical protein